MKLFISRNLDPSETASDKEAIEIVNQKVKETPKLKQIAIALGKTKEQANEQSV